MMIHPRLIFYSVLLFTSIPLWGLYHYFSGYLQVSDEHIRRQIVEAIAMLGMFSWPLWLGLAGYSVIRWRMLKAYERLIAWMPMVIFLAVYIKVLTDN